MTAFAKVTRQCMPPKGLIVHSDRGGQYASNAFRARLKQHAFRSSMSRTDNCYDNAFMESCFSRFKAELLENGSFHHEQDAQTEIFDFIECYYNTKRLHSGIGYQIPDQYEQNFYSLRE